MSEPNDSQAGETAETPVTVESGAGNDAVTAPAAELPFSEEEEVAILADLIALQKRAVENGTTITEIIAVAAKNAYGVDIR